MLVELVGMSPAEAIASATTGAARLLGLENEIGRIAPGFSADLIAVDGDPLADVRRARACRFRDGPRPRRWSEAMSDADYKIAIGHGSRTGWRATRSAFKIPSTTLDIFVVRDFLDQADCDGLIAPDRRRRMPSQLLPPTEDPEFRTSESCNLDPLDPLVEPVEAQDHRRCSASIPRYGETIQGQRYAVGQQFKPHHDFFYPGRALLAGDGADRRPAHLDRDGLPQRRPRAAARPSSRTPASRSRRAPATCSPGTISTRRRAQCTRSTRACRSPPGSNISSPNGTASGPGCYPTSPTY